MTVVLPPDAIVWRQPYLGETADGSPLWWAAIPAWPGDAHRVTVLPKEARSAWVWDWVPDLMGYRLRERRDDDDD